MGVPADHQHQYARCERALIMSVPALIFTYLVAALAGLSALGIYTEFRRRRFEPPSNPDSIFRCRKCDFVYTDDPDVDRSRCSQCGQMNDAIKF